MKDEPPTRKWYHWYSPEDTVEERKLVLKLDLLIVPYAFVLYWIKYMDQTNISASLSTCYHSNHTRNTSY